MTPIREADGRQLGWLTPRPAHMDQADYVAEAVRGVNAGRPREAWLSAATLLHAQEQHVPVYRTAMGPLPAIPSGCR